MADNYLENRMEQHRLQRYEGKSRHSLSGSTASSRTPRTGRMIVDFDPNLRVLILASEFSPLVEAVVSEFRKLDAKVDFCCGQSTCASKVAQRYGARFLPLSEEKATEESLRYRNGIDVVVTFGDYVIDSLPENAIIVAVDRSEDGKVVELTGDTRSVSTNYLSTEGAARLIVLQSHPSMKRISGK